MPCGATQDGRVMMERSDRMWSSAEGNGKPRQYSRLENPVNSILIIYWLFFISSTSLLNISCIISILASRLFLCNSIFFSIFCVIFAIIIQNSLSGRFHISPSFVSWAFILFLYLLGISLPFHLVYVAAFVVAFPHSGSLWLLFIVEVPCCGWGWMGGLSRLPG